MIETTMPVKFFALLDSSNVCTNKLQKAAVKMLSTWADRRLFTDILAFHSQRIEV